jgi:hypothetical protein
MRSYIAKHGSNGRGQHVRGKARGSEPQTPAIVAMDRASRSIIQALEELWRLANLARGNPDGMCHLLWLYGLDRHFKSQLQDMKRAWRP